MLVGLGSYACAWAIGVPGHTPARGMDAAGFLEVAASLGYRMVQIADNLPLHELSAAQLERLGHRARRLGLALQVGTRGLTEDNLERYLGIARELGSPILRVVADSPGHQPEPPEMVTILRSVLPDFARAGVVLALENHDRFTTTTLRSILDEVDDPQLGICLDTVNSFGALEGPEVVLERLAAYVINLHLKDFVVRRLPHLMGFEVVGAPAGEGRLDIPRLLAVFADRPAVTAVLELWPPPAGTLEDSIARERRWLERSTDYLRRTVGL